MGEPADLPYIRVQLMLQKKDEVTEEFFHNYWKTNHVKLALENKKFVDKVIRYNQWHASPRLREAAQQFKIPVPNYDGIAEVWVKDVETWQEIVTDPAFVAAIAPDENNFIKAPIHIMLGYDNTVLGEPIKAK
ncbi:hypothetical protein BU26DRAFT_561739 [Trematosphaeria pertusa]|uniref:EthD domain-containing protein n=1 Tax=Trematosphaeria pertusa TaxID=390896 RepID=A0A6A6IPG2_9PLEO|nr:uncharacterized protein BU26DRAFT_561739 [Trematosphaeria pertusa]KAF2251958.1 hypothetical protein BU26DRAFT_561739 [Trematosphaeria pertusa]